jgi:hypothetical protein
MFLCRRTLAAALMLATLPLLTACGTSSPPPLIQTQVVKVRPPAGPLADIQPPDLPEQAATRDDMNALTLGLAGWGASLRARLGELRDWSAAP